MFINLDMKIHLKNTKLINPPEEQIAGTITSKPQSHVKIIKLLIATGYYNILSLGIILLSNTILSIGHQPMRDLQKYEFLYATSVKMSIQYKHASGELFATSFR